ncbi:hypothetical protein VTN96DRAFT_8376 [Rasamsonia emersonii]|uniref:Uncharacterized protein n=1 Tax=Rasamsonia emersonii (strain ATCC 16479 / CBS 393.64 / IMI 116815) TaxID=1408163 RepID=A0A0F4YXW8_RASE3|nr:hypothetical protein T310_3052 [Rasamsonia emersonii CBS 393.64]KKA22945.1 hypothetical protein T310_3052 [Rasamsonia emersonii CBS 393.64]
MKCSTILILLCHAWMTLGLPLQSTRQITSPSNASFSILSPSYPKTLKHKLGLILNVGSLAWHGYRHSHGRPSARIDGMETILYSKEQPWTENCRQTLQYVWDFYVLRSPSPSQMSSPLQSSAAQAQLLRLNAVEDSASLPWSLLAAPQLSKGNGVDVTATKGRATATRPYGTFLPKATPPASRSSIVPFRRPNLTETLIRSVSRMDLAALCHKFSPEIIGLGIFLLVPAAVLVVECMDRLYDWCTPERFPERGRSRVRLTGAERQLSALAAWEREKMVEQHSRRWWRLGRRKR